MEEAISIFERRRRNLQQLLESRYRGSQAEMARAIGRSPSYVWRLLSPMGSSHAKHLGEDLARQIESAANLLSYWLDQDKALARSVLQVPAEVSDVAQVPRRVVGPRAIPIYDIASIEVHDHLPLRGTVVGLAYTDTPLEPTAFAVIVQGDAMEPDLLAGDKAFIDPSLEPLPGDVVLARAGAAVVLRQFRPAGDGTGRFELSAANGGYAAISSDRTPCKIVGVMVEHHRYRGRR